MNIRIGMGFDVHELEEGRNFWMGGIRNQIAINKRSYRTL
jgi:2C-methyl-D-erythritol 2,4-cyclodiphosphate synthase